MSTLPYCSNVTAHHNKCIHNMNTHLYNITCRHSDAILLIDLNTFIQKFILTQDTMYLSKRYLTQIATLVAYNIYDPIVTNIIGNKVSNATNIPLN